MKKKEITPLTSEEKQTYCKQNVCHIFKKELNNDNEDNGIAFKKYCKIKYHC